jgi:hypothetical protein
MTRSREDFSVAAAVNDREILAACLMRSPDLASGGLTLRTYEGYDSAAKALNDGLKESAAPIVIFAHQDVYFPKGWLDRLIAQIKIVEGGHPNWGVIGLYGRRVVSGDEVGLVWSTGLGRLVGTGGFEPAEVQTLDELTLIVRRDSGLSFDEGIPSFHLYGTDIVTQGRDRGIPSFVVDAPAIHNSTPTRKLTGMYARGYRYMQRKWRRYLPISCLNGDIVWHPLRLWRAQRRQLFLYRKNISYPKRDAVEIAKSLKFE